MESPFIHALEEIIIRYDEKVIITGKMREAAKRAIESMIEKWKTSYPMRKSSPFPLGR